LCDLQQDAGAKLARRDQALFGCPLVPAGYTLLVEIALPAELSTNLVDLQTRRVNDCADK